MTVREWLAWLGTPLRSIAAAIRFLVDLTPQQLKSIFSLSMLGGMMALSWHNVWYTYRAEAVVAKGAGYQPFFAMLLEQMRFNSGLIAWFALIMGLIVFGADYFHAKLGEKEIELRKGKEEGDGAAGPQA